MPDGFALAALSHALRTRIRQVIDDAADVAQTGPYDVVSKAPEELSSAHPTKATLTIYPWRLLPDRTSSRGPAYSPGGERRATPLLALDVLYVLAAYAQDSADVDGVLGLALLGLHETPPLSRDRLQTLANGTFPAGSALPQALRDLAEQAAQITVEPLNFEIEELSQVWSTLNGGVRTGMIFRVGTLLMESRRRAATAPPVREGRLSVALLRAPTIQRVRFAANAAGPFAERTIGSPGEVLRIEGTGLQGDITHVALGERTIATEPARLRPYRIELDLPADLQPGLVALQVRQDWPKPPGQLPPAASGTISGERSNLVPVAIRPVLAAAGPFAIGNRQVGSDGAVAFDVTVHFDVAVGNRQRLELMLNATAAGPDGRFRSYAFTAPQPAPGVPDAQLASRTLTIAGVAAGNYLARVTIDGAESALREDATGVTGPILTVPA